MEMQRMIKNIKYFGVDKNYKIILKEMNELIIPHDHIVIKVDSFGLNRADLLQKVGKYQAPLSHSQILGLECSGYIYNPSTNSITSQKVMALLPGGGYSEYVTVHKNHLMYINDNKNLSEYCAIPEAMLTSLMLLDKSIKFEKQKVRKKAMVYAGASGVGTTLIQLLNHYNYDTYCTVGSQQKVDFISNNLNLSMDRIMNYKQMDFNGIIEKIEKDSFDLLFDCVGASNYELSRQLLGMDSHWVMFGFLGGSIINQFNFMSLLSKRITLSTLTLRNQTDQFKTHLIQLYYQLAIHQLIADSSIKPIIDKIVQLQIDHKGAEQVEELHQYMQSNLNVGKIIVKINQQS